MRVHQEQVRHPDQAFRFLRFEIDAAQGGRHRHRQLELTWIERGEGLRFVGDSALPFGDGDLVLLGSDVPHAWVSGGPGRPGRVVATVLQFSPELLANPALPELAAFAPLAERAALGLQWTGEAQATVTAELSAMARADAIGRLAGLVRVMGLLVARGAQARPLSSAALRRSGTSPDDPAGLAAARPGRRIDRVVDWIHRHLDRELTVADAARQAHVTPAAFSRYFRREVGKPFTRYLNDVRCSEASLRLRRSDLPVASIAQACGFATMSHFNAQFRLRMGMAPREFRRLGAAASLHPPSSGTTVMDQAFDARRAWVAGGSHGDAIAAGGGAP